MHLPVQMPNADALEKLRKADPKLYKIWVDLVADRVKHDMWMERAPYELPYKLAKRGQSAAIVGLIIVAILCGLAIYLDHPWVAAFLGGVDLVGIVAAFAGSDGASGSDGAHREE
jgi:hypothetical protein